MILDWWGITPDPKVSAPYQANTPFIDFLVSNYPTSRLRTDGEYVGLPDGQMGNSEVGHMNLGAGRIVYQNLVRINKAVREWTLAKESVLLEAIQYAQKQHKKIHLLGLVSDGGIHSHLDHLKALLHLFSSHHLNQVFVHAFTDGRDCDPKSWISFLEDLQGYMQQTTGKLASVIGRYYAMDRDNRWERIKKAYDLLVFGQWIPSNNLKETILESYKKGVTDEFLEPIVMVDENHKPIANISDGDVVLFFNYRTDRGRELTQALSQQDIPSYQMYKIPLYYLTMTNYDKNFENVHVIYDTDNLTNTLGEVISKAGKKQIRIAETEKYPHVTFFFSWGREEPFEGESRILCPSPKVATYDLKPEMSAYEVCDAILPKLESGDCDFVCLNFANGDMVGHTWVMEAAIKACEAVDICVKRVVETGLEYGYSIIILADHGNCEIMRNTDGSPHTSHTKEPVACILVDSDKIPIKDWILSDIAPTVLKLMGIPQPPEMNQSALV